MNGHMNLRRPSAHPGLLLPVLLSLLFACSGCLQEPLNAPFASRPASPPTSYRNATLPLDQDNRWIYADSLFGDPVDTLVRVDTLTSTVSWYGVLGLSGPGVWYLTYPGQGICIGKDTVYAVDSWPQGMDLYPLYTPLPAPGDTLRLPPSIHNNPLSYRKVYALGHPLTVPAGTFDSVEVCEWWGVNDPITTYREFFRPRVGVLAAASYYYTGGYGEVLKVVRRDYRVLISRNLVH